MIGVGFRILTRTPVPKLPRVPIQHLDPSLKKVGPPPPPPRREFKTFSLSVYVNCVQLHSLLQVALIMLRT